MKFIVIETFKTGMESLVYQRFEERGRMLPEGLVYISSWLARDGRRCFQLMESEREDLFDEWIAEWNDLVEFEVVPLSTSPNDQCQAL